jgi:hypothetical protein
MGKKNKTSKKSESLDITIKMLEDPRITTKDIELYNLVLQDFPSSQINDPISIYNSKTAALETYNKYIKITLETPGLTEEQIKKCLLNSYVRYYTHMLGFNS